MLGKQVGGCTDATVRVYSAWLGQIQAQVGGDPRALDSAAITRFLAGLRARGLSPSSVHQAYRSVKTFCRWLLATGAIKHNPLAGVSMRTPATLPQVPTEDELRAVLACCPGTIEGARNCALILVMADAGLRASEAVRLLVENWNPQERSRRLHPHLLRHFAATSWLRNGIGLDQVRRLLGHASLHTTLRYSSLVAADLQRAHKDCDLREPPQVRFIDPHCRRRAVRDPP